MLVSFIVHAVCPAWCSRHHLTFCFGGLPDEVLPTSSPSYRPYPAQSMPLIIATTIKSVLCTYFAMSAMSAM
ncbi:hypothetical protein GGR50DRAFT_663359 [Xylaria sp. CBS 124048]|nr:hypothetical protein GGR50DRAFT_663359 [Xylaria sp. CBS 124048]